MSKSVKNQTEVSTREPKEGIFIMFAILAALLYALSTPVSKVLLNKIPSTLLAGILYFGAGIGMSIMYFVRSIFIKDKEKEESLNKKDLPYVIGMVVLDIAAPILLLLALTTGSPEEVSLLNNFEIVATSLIALWFFKEKIGVNLWIGIILITGGSIFLSFNPNEGISFSIGSVYALLATVCWGLENNCTRMISSKSPYQIVIIKGIFSGLGSIIIGLILSERITDWLYVCYALILGFFAYGLSVFFYVLAQRRLKASKTAVFYSLSPFISVLLSLIIFQDMPSYFFFIALGLMAVGFVFTSLDKIKEDKKEAKEVTLS